MKKIILLEFISLDGVMQAPGGQEEDKSGGFEYGGWTVPFSDEASGALMQKQMALPFELLLGRKTFDIFQAYWPAHENMWPGINDVRKYVVTDTPMQPTWNNTTVIQDNVVEELKNLKNQDGPDLYVYGSGDLAQTLLKNDLVDELWLKIFPVTLGSGKKLFAQGTIAAAFKLTSSAITPSGVIFANYRRDGQVKTGSF